PLEQPAETHRLSGQSQRRHGVGLHVRRHRRGGRGQGRRLDVLHLRAVVLRRKGVDAPGTSNLWQEYQSWKGGPEEKKALESGLIGSPETIRKKLRQFQQSRVDQVILLNQAGKTSHKDICESLELFAKEVMPEFHAAESEHTEWKRKVLAREIVLEDLDVQKYDIYSHQNEHIVRLTPEQLKAKMAEKEARRA